MRKKPLAPKPEGKDFGPIMKDGFHVYIDDNLWPRLTISVVDGGTAFSTTAYYDIAQTAFEPAVTRALGMLVRRVREKHGK